MYAIVWRGSLSSCLNQYSFIVMGGWGEQTKNLTHWTNTPLISNGNIQEWTFAKFLEETCKLCCGCCNSYHSPPFSFEPSKSSTCCTTWMSLTLSISLTFSLYPLFPFSFPSLPPFFPSFALPSPRIRFLISSSLSFSPLFHTHTHTLSLCVCVCVCVCLFILHEVSNVLTVAGTSSSLGWCCPGENSAR